MLRINPEDVTNDVIKVGTIGLPDKLSYDDKKYFKYLMAESLKEASGNLKNQGYSYRQPRFVIQ